MRLDASVAGRARTNERPRPVAAQRLISARRWGRSGDAGLQEPPPVNESPSPALTRRFLALCEQYGSQRLAVQVVAVDRSTGVEGLPASDDWNTWDAGEMQAAVDYLRRKRGLTR